MNADTIKLKGCESKDNFKRNHKNLLPRYYAMDYDLVLMEMVNKKPVPFCIIDYKAKRDEDLNWSHIICYNYEREHNNKRVFIFEGSRDARPTHDQPFFIKEFIRGYPNGERDTEYGSEWVVKSEREWIEWEGRIRMEAVLEWSKNKGVDIGTE
jgi:hypothetical protein